MKLDMDKILLLAAKQCWNLPELSAKAGISNTTLYKQKGYYKSVSSKTLGKLAKALGCEPQDIVLQE